MFDVGGGELLLILLAVLVLFGPKKIPELAQMMGKGMQQIRKAQAQLNDQIKEIQHEVQAVVEEKPVIDVKPVKQIDNTPVEVIDVKPVEGKEAAGKEEMET